MKRFLAALCGGLLLTSAAYAAPPDDATPNCPMMHRDMMSRQMSIGIKPILNSANGGIVTMMGFEGLGVTPGGWKAGMGMYAGLNLGITSYSSGLHYGGIILGKDLTLGGLGLDAGILAGFGHTLDMTPTLGFNNIYLFGLLEPRIGLSIPLSPMASLGIDAAYLLTNNPNAAFGPSIFARFTVGHR